MAQVSSFEKYKQKTVMDLSNIENNRGEEKRENKVEDVITFTGSKLWLDLELDRGYYLLNKSHSTCLNFCYNSNFHQNIKNLTQDDQRVESMACQVNCLLKISQTSNLLNESVKNHPRSVRNNQEFTRIQQEISNINQQLTNRKL